MTEPTIVCPGCKQEIKLTESLAAPLIESTRQQYEQRLSRQTAEISKREEVVRQQQEALAKAKEAIDEQVAQRLEAERARLVAEEAKKARQAAAADLSQKEKELAELQAVLIENNKKLAEAQQAQAELIRKQRELDDAKREMELTIERRVQENVALVRESARKQAEDELGLKVSEKEQVIEAMKRQIEDLKRRAEQGSQQLQGEVLELALESVLREEFPRDAIDPVAKGEYGGDVLQGVAGPTGQVCGKILWESKRTKNWNDEWLSKLREDQRAAKAECAVIVSQALPKDVDSFNFVDGVWVTSPRTFLPLAVVLRQTLIQLASARQAGEGQQTKMELVYSYLTGPRFRHRVEAIVEKFSEMQEDLDRERKTMTRMWAKRQEQLRGAIESTAGMYGDLQGIAGKSLSEIEGLELTLLEAEPAQPAALIAEPADNGKQTLASR